MTNDETKKAWINKQPVTCNGIDYTKISALIYRLNDNGEMTLSVELLDKNGNCVVIASPQKVELKSERN